VPTLLHQHWFLSHTPGPRLQPLLSALPVQDKLKEACTSAGVAQYGNPVNLDDKLKVRVRYKAGQ
jgi:hypothetical protein